MLRVRARTPLYASEDEDKVRKAIATVFPEARIVAHEGWLEAETDRLDHFRHLIRKQKILDAARKSLLRSLDEAGTRAVFELNKQAACAGRLSFALERTPLGNLVVTVEGDDLERRFKEMAPMTIRGIPVSEEQAERHLEKLRRRKASEPKWTETEPEVEVEAEIGEEEKE